MFNNRKKTFEVLKTALFKQTIDRENILFPAQIARPLGRLTVRWEIYLANVQYYY